MDSTRVVAAAVLVLVAGCAGPVARPEAAPAAAGAPVVVTTSTSTTTSTSSATSTSAPAAPTQPAPSSPSPSPATVGAPPRTRPSAAATPAAALACRGLANRLAATGTARQLITVVAAGWGTYYANVELWQKSGRCWVSVSGPWPGYIGENGFVTPDHKTEGDGTTPTGMYGVGSTMYGNSPDPGVHEPYVRIVPGDWWDEDPTSPNYNHFEYVTPGQTPPGGGSEALWTEQQAYPSFAVIDYNTDPVVAHKGSAIFLHADIGGPTAGCVSIPLDDLDYTLDWIQPADHPAFVMGPAQAIAAY